MTTAATTPGAPHAHPTPSLAALALHRSPALTSTLLEALATAAPAHPALGDLWQAVEAAYCLGDLQALDAARARIVSALVAVGVRG